MYPFANRWPGHVHDTIWHMTVFDLVYSLAASYVSILHEALITIEPLAAANNSFVYDFP